jgi:phosphomannomutase
LSKEFATEVAMILAHHGIVVHLTDDFSSTPQVSFNTKQKGVDLGIVITASHNPPQYNGFKLKASFGGPATPEQVAAVEKELAKIVAAKKTNLELLPLETYIAQRKIRYFNAKESFIRLIKKKVKVNEIREAGLKVVVDSMYGAGAGNMAILLPEVDEIHGEYNPSFGKIHHPEPIAENLFPLAEKVRTEKYDVGFAFDGDADRLGAVDHMGEFVDSHKIFMILLKYLVEVRKKRGPVVKTISLTSMVDMYCEKKNLELIETPVGFKYVAELMAKPNSTVLIGGEESGGLGTVLHIPERDGLFNAMLLLEVMVMRKKSLRELCQELDDEFGAHRFMRKDKVVTQKQKVAILAAAEKEPSRLGKYNVIRVSRKDGYKFFVENGWVLIRASGTEPLIRIYAEADSMGKVSELILEIERLAK